MFNQFVVTSACDDTTRFRSEIAECCSAPPRPAVPRRALYLLCSPDALRTRTTTYLSTHRVHGQQRAP